MAEKNYISLNENGEYELIETPRLKGCTCCDRQLHQVGCDCGAEEDFCKKEKSKD